jgi:16S rRNA (guanine966-N2)-methyltransferase
MRIIAGSAKGRRLETPPDGTRPLTGKAREALFSILGDAVVGAAVLDLYAGSGSFGLEALSRGAGDALFVEWARPATVVLQENIDAIGLGGRVEPGDVEDYLGRSSQTFDVVFVDPPWALDDTAVDQVLTLVEPLVNQGGIVVVHRRAGGREPVSDNLRLTDRRRYGDTELWLYAKERA